MLEITRTITIKASPEQVYQWISQAEYLQKWFADTTSRNGDTITFAWNQQDGGTVGFDAKVTVDNAPSQFAYQSVEDKPTTTQFELSVDGDGTQLTLTESPFTDDEAGRSSMQEHEGGWDFFLMRLQQLGV
ncbi:MAG: SRPBCC domain-containing protein [Chloroflexota bacterium]